MLTFKVVKEHLIAVKTINLLNAVQFTSLVSPELSNQKQSANRIGGGGNYVTLFVTVAAQTYYIGGGAQTGGIWINCRC